MSQMVGNHPEWWRLAAARVGTPIRRRLHGCNESVLEPQLARNFARAMRARSFDQGNASDLWWTEPLETFAPPGLTCAKCGGTAFEKSKHRRHLFESGGHLAGGAGRARMKFPADAYLGGGDSVPRLVSLEPDHVGGTPSRAS